MRLTSQDTQFERKLNQLLRAIRRRVRSAQKQKHCVYGEKGKTSQRRKNMSVSSSVRVVSVVSAHYIYRPVFSSHFSHTSIHYYPSKHILGGKSPELSASQGSSERPSRKVSGQSTCCSYVVRDPTKFYFPFFCTALRWVGPALVLIRKSSVQKSPSSVLSQSFCLKYYCSTS